MCIGATKWVHQSCLQQWIDEKQKMSSSVLVQCPQCKYNYRIVYPPSSPPLYIFEYVDRGVTFISPIILASLTAATLYWSSFSHGVSTIMLAVGWDQAVQSMSSPEASVLVVCLPIIPWVVFAVKALRPEALALQAWYRFVVPCISHIAKLLKIASSPEINSRRFVPCSIPPLAYVSRCAVSTIIFPLVSALLSKVLFNSVSSGPKRLLMVSLYA